MVRHKWSCFKDSLGGLYPRLRSPLPRLERIKMRVIIKKNYSHSNMARHKWGGFKDSLGFWVSNTDNLLRFE